MVFHGKETIGLSFIFFPGTGDAKTFLEEEFGVPVYVTAAEESGHTKAATALPFKPAIVIE